MRIRCFGYVTEQHVCIGGGTCREGHGLVSGEVDVEVHHEGVAEVLSREPHSEGDAECLRGGDGACHVWCVCVCVRVCVCICVRARGLVPTDIESA